jgi:multiple sugar transport system substrate-binding protein
MNHSKESVLQKKIVAAAAVIAVGVALTGCSSSSSTAPKTVTLSFWSGFTGGDRAGYQQIVDDFNASQKGIKVDFSAQPWDSLDKKLPSAWLTSAGPDIASIDGSNLAQFVKTNEVLPLTDTGTGASQINTGQFNSALNDQFTFNGKLYGIPANFATLSLYYNKSLFAKAGIAAPPSTLAEFQADAKKLTAGGVFGLSLGDNNTIPMWPILQWLGGGDIVNSQGCSAVQTPASIASLKPWVNLVVKDKISPVGQTGAEADSLFSANKAAMEMNGPWAAPGYKSAGIDLGIAQIPTGSDGKHVTYGGASPIAISAKTKYPAQAQKFLAYYTGRAAQLKFSLKTGFPSFRTDLSSDPKLAADPVVSIFTKAVPYARLYLPQVTNASDVDAKGYIPFIGEITRGTSLTTAAAATASTINGLTGCTK